MFNRARAIIGEMQTAFDVEDQGCIRRIEMLETQRNEYATGLVELGNQAEVMLQERNMEYSEELARVKQRSEAYVGYQDESISKTSPAMTTNGIPYGSQLSASVTLFGLPSILSGSAMTPFMRDNIISPVSLIYFVAFASSLANNSGLSSVFPPPFRGLELEPRKGGGKTDDRPELFAREDANATKYMRETGEMILSLMKDEQNGVIALPDKIEGKPKSQPPASKSRPQSPAIKAMPSSSSSTTRHPPPPPLPTRRQDESGEHDTYADDQSTTNEPAQSSQTPVNPQSNQWGRWEQDNWNKGRGRGGSRGNRGWSRRTNRNWDYYSG